MAPYGHALPYQQAPPPLHQHQQAARPHQPPAAQPGSMPGSIDEMLDRWVDAKRRKDYALSDKIREELKSLGVKPDEVRPNNQGADWQCTACGKTNWPKRSQCFKCGQSRFPGLEMLDHDEQAKRRKTSLD